MIERMILRSATAITLGIPLLEIRCALLDSGCTEEEAFLTVQAAIVLVMMREV